MNGYVFVTPCHGLTPCLLPPKQNALLFSEVACMQDELSARTEGKRLDTIPFAIGFLSVFAFIVSAIAFPEPFIRFMDLLQDKIVKDLGWASVFFSFLVMLFTFGIVCSPIGSIRIGGRDAKPDFSFFRWFAISLCSGIGIGILFWGIGEPIYHLMQPPQNLGIAPKSHEAALFAISQSAMHWSIAQYCIYAICGVAFALMAFNEHLPLSIISGLDLVMPRKHYSLAKNIVHAACLFSICCTVISSIGALIMMISSCVSYLTGLERSFAMNAIVALVATAFFVGSSTTGLKRGMNFLAAQNTRMFFIILFYIFLFGPTLFILNMGTEAFGYMLTNFIRNSTLVSTEFMSDRWADSWIIVYMGCVFCLWSSHRFISCQVGQGAYRAAIPSHERVCSIHVRVSLDQHFWQPCHLLSVEESCGRMELCSDAGFGIHRYRHPAALPIQHGPHCFLCHCDYDFLCHTGRSHDFRVGDHFHQRYFR